MLNWDAFDEKSECVETEKRSENKKSGKMNDTIFYKHSVVSAERNGVEIKYLLRKMLSMFMLIMIALAITCGVMHNFFIQIGLIS